MVVDQFLSHRLPFLEGVAEMGHALFDLLDLRFAFRLTNVEQFGQTAA